MCTKAGWDGDDFDDDDNDAEDDTFLNNKNAMQQPLESSGLPKPLFLAKIYA